MRSTILRAQLESALGERASSPFTDIEKRVWERIPSGIAVLDAAIGGLPRGAITEICGDPSSGRTSIALSILSELSGQQEVCALVDGTDAFDPESGAAAGMELSRLLWIRCRTLDQVLRSTDLLLQGGGFGLVALDLSDLPQQAIRNIPLASWFRFQRTIEDTPTILLLIGRESAAKSAATLVLQTSLKQAVWSPSPPDTGGGQAYRHFVALDHPVRAVARPPLLCKEGTTTPSHGLLLSAHHLELEVLRLRHPNPKSEIRNPKFPHHVRLHSCS